MTKRTDGPSAEVRIRVMKRDRFQCTYCGAPGTDSELEIDHIVAVSKGGSHHVSNLTTACRACNQAKGDKTMRPATARPNGLVGMFLHTKTPDGEINWQGRVIGMHGGNCLVQLFSWWDGGPTKVVPISEADVLASDLFATNEQMVRAHLTHEARKGRLHGSVDDEMEAWRRITGVA